MSNIPPQNDGPSNFDDYSFDQNPYAPPSPDGGNYPVPPPPPLSGQTTSSADIMAILSVIFGGLSIPSVCCCWIFGLAFAMAGVGLGIAGLSGKQYRVLAIIGICLGGICLVMYAALFILLIFVELSGGGGFHVGPGEFEPWD